MFDFCTILKILICCSLTYDLRSSNIRKFQDNLKSRQNYSLVPSLPITMKILKLVKIHEIFFLNYMCMIVASRKKRFVHTFHLFTGNM